MDKLDWALTSEEEERHYFVPAEDHTLGTERGKPERERSCIPLLISQDLVSQEAERTILWSFLNIKLILCMCVKVWKPSLSFLPGHFLFFPSSDRTAANQNAQLLSPHLPPTKGTCLKFWVYKPFSCKDQCSQWKFVLHLQIRYSSCCVHALILLWRPFTCSLDVCDACPVWCFVTFFFFYVRSGHRAEGVEAVWRSSPSAAGGGWSGRTVETLRRRHHIYWGIPGRALTIYTNIAPLTLQLQQPYAVSCMWAFPQHKKRYFKFCT